MKFLLLLLLPFTLYSKDLPKNLKWEDGSEQKVYSSPNAKKGGMFKYYIQSFPLTLRTVGPDANGSFRSYILDNQLPLTDFHPNTKNIIPLIAEKWAYGNDNKTIYFKINPKAKWSDGKPITADDFVFSLEYFRSKHLVAPWYNDYYTKEVKEVIKYDKLTIAIVGANPKSERELHYQYSIVPTPKHFYKKIEKNFIKKYNWKIVPNTGAYQISEVKKGKYVMFKRKKNWWGESSRFLKNRFNVDKVKISVIRNPDIAYEHFRKGKIDHFRVTEPDYWHKKAVGPIYDNGYATKIWFYNDRPRPVWGIYMNQDVELLKDKNIRLGLQHSFNFKKVLRTVLRGDFERMNANTIGAGVYDNKKITARPFDLKLADKYFTKAGWGKRGTDGIRVKNGKRLSITMTHGRPPHADRIVVFKEEAKKAGVEIKIKQLDGAASFKAMLEKQHELAYTGWGATDFPQYWGQWHSQFAHKKQTNNFSNTDDKKLDEYIDGYKTILDEKEKSGFAHKIQQRIYDNAAFIPMWLTPYIREAYWNWMKLPKVPGTKNSRSFLFDPFHATFGGLFWIDKDEKKSVLAAKKSKKKLKANTIIDKTFRK